MTTHPSSAFPAAWNCVAIVMRTCLPQTPAWGFNIAATIFPAIMTSCRCTFHTRRA